MNEPHQPIHEIPTGVPAVMYRNMAKHHFVFWFQGEEDWRIVIVWRWYSRKRGWQYHCESRTEDTLGKYWITEPSQYPHPPNRLQ